VVLRAATVLVVHSGARGTELQVGAVIRLVGPASGRRFISGCRAYPRAFARHQQIIARTVDAPHAALVAGSGGVVVADDLAIAHRPSRRRIGPDIIERELAAIVIPHPAVERHADAGARTSATDAHNRHVELIIGPAERDALTFRRESRIADRVPEARGERTGRRIRVPVQHYAVITDQVLLRRGDGGRLRRGHGSLFGAVARIEVRLLV